MIAVLFRWEIKPGCEQPFKEGWSEIIHRNIEKYGALGSRLHKTKDNHWLSYSQWISEEHFINAQNLKDKHEEARVKMINAISKAYDPIVMVPMLDHLMATELSHPHLLP
ncbi:MAG: heme-degrading monooxygenase HmoA [Psychromonas sp.]|jgi:heme-degrading monooxygenase HmoA|uniref:antibiotic biosynthesis monooxygenase family protein n=1 Tax=Psychromonas sp. TaxID=1884585 RepID=UPI0039E5B03A